MTQGDDVSGITDAGYGNIATRGKYDGLGGYLSGNNLSIFINHESSNAAISRLDWGLANFQQALPARSIADRLRFRVPSLRHGLCLRLNS